ncbi:MAG: GTPase domain-containing protein [Thermoguttaceae bacterium]|nr:GTPase domain-containing protein [Thermoguttaceae bacterium]
MSYKNKTLNPPADNKEPLSEEELSRLEPVIISVVGPTNEGTTSVLRTLTGDPQFGEINSLTGTTGHAEYKKIFYHDKAEVLRLIDTPGFQMSSAIVDQLQEREGATGIEAILEAIPESDENYRHDLRAWK